MIDVLTRGDGLLLRTWRTTDFDAMTRLLTDPESRRWSPPLGAPEPGWVAQRLAKAVQSAADDDPTSFVIAAEAEPQRVLGSIDFRRDHPIPPFSVVDVGYGVLPEARGRHVASRALALLSRWVLSPDGMDLERVQLDHAVENVASCRTADRAGFTREGRRARFLPLQESPDAPVVLHDTCLHGLTR
ncbi:MAG TPA: GNAT family protein [Actinomycetales bacterium]|nr:GNAT family protein [Actinomycetales bacterium]